MIIEQLILLSLHLPLVAPSSVLGDALTEVWPEKPLLAI